jgi:hypothetical protein
MTRPVAHTTGACLPCPKCGRALVYGDLHEGAGWLQCQHKRGGGRACAARVYWLCYRRVCTVVGVSTPEYERLRHEDDPAAVLGALGVLLEPGATAGRAA